MAMGFCRGCGQQLHSEASACPHCGAPQHPVGPAPGSDARLLLLVESQKKSGWIAALLNWFIPGAGYMYCQRVGLGIFVLLFTIVVGVATAGVALLVLMPIFIIDGFLAANRFNQKLLTRVLAGSVA
jgi:hypothetical protein